MVGMAETLRWGILGSAGIARKNWEAIKNSGNGVVTAVASRDAAKAQQFIAECQGEVPYADPPRAIGGYEEIVTAADVDAVYIPLPTGLRKEWVIKAAAAGKHVMCEKPCAVDAAALEAMTGACAANNVQFMDGVMYMHSGRMPLLRAALDDPANIGTIKRIASAFTFCAPPEFFGDNIRANSELEPAGALGDLGWYTIRATLFVMGYEMPVSLRATMLSTASRPDSPHPVPSELSAELFFANGVSAAFYNSFLTENQQWLHVSGTKGHLRVDDFVLPFPGGRLGFVVSNPKFVQDGCKATMEKHETGYAVEEMQANDPNAQETKLFRTFARLALSGSPDPFWPEISLKTQRVLDACLHSARNGGVTVEL
jgi:predicted dehydrogenase